MSFPAALPIPRCVEFPELHSVIGSSDEELAWLVGYYRATYNEDYSLAKHRAHEQPRHRVTVAPFALGVTPVTNGEFLAFVGDTAYHGGAPYRTRAEREGLKGNWRAPVGATKRLEFFALASDDDATWLRHPVSCLDWREALLYCHWLGVVAGLVDPARPGERFADFVGLYEAAESPDVEAPVHLGWPGYRLPTSAEWEAASRFDPTRDDRCNPAAWWWGDRLEDGDGLCNAADRTSKRRFRGWITCPWEGTHIYTAPVASYPATPAGLHDMAGNMWEWCLDTFHPAFYADGPRRDPLCLRDPRAVDPASGAALPPLRIARGGGWHNLPANIRQASRRVHEPGRIRCNLGLRVARRVG